MQSLPCDTACIGKTVTYNMAASRVSKAQPARLLYTTDALCLLPTLKLPCAQLQDPTNTTPMPDFEKLHTDCGGPSSRTIQDLYKLLVPYLTTVRPASASSAGSTCACNSQGYAKGMSCTSWPAGSCRSSKVPSQAQHVTVHIRVCLVADDTQSHGVHSINHVCACCYVVLVLPCHIAWQAGAREGR